MSGSALYHELFSALESSKAYERVSQPFQSSFFSSQTARSVPRRSALYIDEIVCHLMLSTARRICECFQEPASIDQLLLAIDIRSEWPFCSTVGVGCTRMKL